MFRTKIGIGFIAAVCLAFANTLPAAPQDNKPQSQSDPHVNKLLTEVIADRDVPGISAAVMRNGTTVAAGSAGLRKVRTEFALEVSDKMHLGSCTKAITATMIGALVDEGQLDWSDTIAQRLPEIKDEIDDSYHSVTLWQLLTHRGGIIANGPNWTGGGIATHENRLKIIAAGLKKKPDSAKVGKYRYSNLGYMVAGTIAESVMDQSWEDLIQEKIFEPLKMHSAGFGPPSTKGKTDQPWGHRIDNKGELLGTQFDNPPSMGPASTVHCNIVDWSKFVALHLDIERKNHKLLSSQTIKKLHSPPADKYLPYAGGWIVMKNKDGTYQIAHEGSNTFWLSRVTANPKRGTAEIVVCNVGIKLGRSTNQKAVSRLRKLFSDDN